MKENNVIANALDGFSRALNLTTNDGSLLASVRIDCVFSAACDDEMLEFMQTCTRSYLDGILSGCPQRTVEGE